jgi:hypothetical protein
VASARVCLLEGESMSLLHEQYEATLRENERLLEEIAGLRGMMADANRAFDDYGRAVDEAKRLRDKLAALPAKWEAYRPKYSGEYCAGIESGMELCASDLMEILGAGTAEARETT